MFDRQKGGNAMHLVEQHVISKGDPRFAAINEAAFQSKSLCKAVLYLV
jgi:hypothetical protein